MATRRAQYRTATAALFLSFVVATMLLTFMLGDSGPRSSDQDGGQGEGDRAPIGGATTVHGVATLGQWDAAVAAAAPGDEIRVTATINGRLAYRGAHDGRGGQGSDGTPEAPIVITADPGVWIDPGNKNSGFAGVDVIAADHVHVVGVRVRNAQFGIRCLQCRGSAGRPVRLVGNTVTSIGHSGIVFAGHWDSHAPSDHGLIENNTISLTGLTARQFGEGIYLGYGSVEWIDTTSNVVVRGNDISRTGAEGVDVKPGTREVLVTGNNIHDLAPVDGGAISAHYVNARPNPHPGQVDRVVVSNNRIWNVNQANVPGANDWAIWVGHGGVEIVDNIVWGLRDADSARAVRVRATQAFGPHPIRIERNTFWTRRGWLAEGQPSGAANVIANDNRGVDAGSSEIIVDAASFVGPAPSIGAAGAADIGGGPGSALALLSAAPAPAPATTPAPAPVVPQPTPAPSAAPAAAPAPAPTPVAPERAPRPATSPSRPAAAPSTPAASPAAAPAATPSPARAPSPARTPTPARAPSPTGSPSPSGSPSPAGIPSPTGVPSPTGTASPTGSGIPTPTGPGSNAPVTGVRPPDSTASLPPGSSTTSGASSELLVSLVATLAMVGPTPSSGTAPSLGSSPAEAGASVAPTAGPTALGPPGAGPGPWSSGLTGPAIGSPVAVAPTSGPVVPTQPAAAGSPALQLPPITVTTPDVAFGLLVLAALASAAAGLTVRAATAVPVPARNGPSRPRL